MLLELLAHEPQIEPGVGAKQVYPIEEILLLRRGEIEPQQRFGRWRLQLRAKNDRVARIGERKIFGARAGVEDVDLHVRLLELGVEPADIHQLELRGEQLVHLVLARRIDERIHIDRHTRPNVERQRICTADDVAHALRVQQPHQLGEHRLHRRAMRFDE